MHSPFFTIITATRNAAAILPCLLESLAGQSCRDFEVVIQDGASTDETPAVAESFRARLPELSIVSEPDTGIYDAWNKALPRAQGEWIVFLGADDSLYGPDSLEQAGVLLRDLPRGIVYAGCSVLLTTPLDVPLEICSPGGTPFIDLPDGMCVPHSALFHHRTLFEKDVFSTDFRIAGDYEFFCRTLTANNYSFDDFLLIRQRVGGISSSLPSMLSRDLEFLRISRRYFPRARRVLLYARIVRSALFCVMHRIFGMKTARAFADLARCIRRKAPLWSTLDRAQPVAADFAESSPLFSLLVATLGREQSLRRLLESLQKQSCRNFELLIADQNPPGFLDALLAEFQNHLPMRVFRIPHQGVSRARNALLPHAQGRLIAFPDDDCWYRQDTLQRAVDMFAIRPHVHVLTGAWHDPSASGKRTGELGERVRNRFSVFKRGETFVQFYRRETVEAVGDFDPELGPGTGLPYGCGEDTDYLLRALAAGFTVAHMPGVHIYHPEPAGNSPPPEKIRAYALGRMHLLRKHNFPLWFKLANIVYPLLRLLLEGAEARPYRKAMFLGRLQGFLQK